MLRELLDLMLVAENEQFTKVTAADYEKWVETVVDMVESGEDFNEAMDLMLDNDPKFEQLSDAQKKAVAKKIRAEYYNHIH